MSNVGGFTIFTDGQALTGVATGLDTNFANILTVINGNLRAENFTARAGIGLQHRGEHGNEFVVSGGSTALNQTAGTGPTTSTIMLDVSAEDLHGDIPAQFKVLTIGGNFEGLTGYGAGDQMPLQYRLYNTRTGAWTAWASQIADAGGAWTASTARRSTAGGAVGSVIGDKDYERIQLSFAVTAAADGADIAARGVSVWITFEALHVP